MARVCNLYRGRVRTIRTVLFLIVASASLSGETVVTKWRPCQEEIMTKTGATIKNRRKQLKKTANTAANEQKHKQDSWKQFVEPNSKMSQAYGEQS